MSRSVGSFCSCLFQVKHLGSRHRIRLELFPRLREEKLKISSENHDKLVTLLPPFAPYMTQQ